MRESSRSVTELPPPENYYTKGRKHRWDPKLADADRWTCLRCGCIRVRISFPPHEPYMWFKSEGAIHQHFEPDCEKALGLTPALPPDSGPCPDAVAQDEGRSKVPITDRLTDTKYLGTADDHRANGRVNGLTSLGIMDPEHARHLDGRP